MKLLRGDNIINEQLMKMECYADDIRITKIPIMTIQIPLIPHGDSEEAGYALRIACPSETDFLYCGVDESYSLIDEEIDYAYEQNNFSIDGERDGRDDYPLDDAFFSDIRCKEEQNELEISLAKLNRIREGRVKDNSLITTIQESQIKSKMPIQAAKQERSIPTFETFKNEFETSIKITHSDESVESMNSLSSSTSFLSYQSASIQKLKSRKRMLEKQLSEKSFYDSFSIQEVSTSKEQSQCPTTVSVV